MIFFTSDTHFCHSNILIYCPNRRFPNIRAHDEHLIECWNSRVSEQDELYHLGDVSLGASLTAAKAVLSRLNGKKHLIIGNHDKRFLKDQEFCDFFIDISLYSEIRVPYRGEIKFVVLSHYPIEDWNRKQRESLHFHGHCHTPSGYIKTRFIKNRKDIGVDGQRDYQPWTIEELIEVMSNEREEDLLKMPERHKTLKEQDIDL